MATAETSQPATPEGFGHLLRRLRAAAELTQEELAERAGVSARLVSDLERGVIHRPRRDTVRLLADGLRLAEAEHDAFVAAARGRPEPGDGSLRRHSLPLPPGPIVGRLKEMAAATALLLPDSAPRPSGNPDYPLGGGATGSRSPAVRLLTLTGPGGVGKTRLALEVASRALDAFADGVYFVDLAPVGDPALVLATIAQELAVRASGELPLHDRLALFLADKRVLLLLDNVEHLTAAAPAIADLLAACPALAVLATSRVPLHVRIEHEYPVAPLALPDLSRLPAVDELARVPAIELFVQQAEAAYRGFALTDGNARAVAEVTIKLDGLPLAIELAAARTRILSPAALLTHLERRLVILTGGARDLPARQQTLRATLDWSHGLLNADEQALFRRLAVFAGGCTLEAAEWVSRAVGYPLGESSSRGEGPALLDSLGALVDKSLLRALTSDDDEQRFGMLETIREYGLESLAAAGEEDHVRTRHAAWSLDLAERADPELTGPDQARWLAKLDAEHDNVRAALSWAIVQCDAATALRLGGALHRFWHLRGHYAEGRRWLEQALALDDEESPAARARALLGAAAITHFQGDYERATAHSEEALSRFRALGDTAGIAAAHRYLGMGARARGDLARAAALDGEALRLYRMLGDRSGVGSMLNNLGLIAYYEGDYARAAALHQESLALRRALGDRNGMAYSLANCALVAHAQGDYDRAAALQEEALDLWWSVGNKDGLAHCFENLALIAAARAEPERVARLFGAAEALRTRIGAPGRPNDRAFNERFIVEPQARLGEAGFAAARAEGRAMSLEEAVAFALERRRQTALGDLRPALGDD